MLELEVAAEASADLDGIMRYSIETFGEEAAERYFASIERTIFRLRDFPESGATYPSITPAIRYADVSSHRIFYSRDGSLLTIRRVLHKAMLPQGRIIPR